MRFQFRKIIKLLASLKLAVFILLSVSVLIAVGTIVEAKYDAYTAKQAIYSSLAMFCIMSLLVINLIAVIIDRFPWKYHHMAFIFAHIGIIVILMGSLLTYLDGIDGTLRLEINNPSNNVVTQDTVLTLYKSNDGVDYKIVHQEDFKVFMNEWSDDRPFILRGKDFEFKIVDAYLYASSKMVIEPTQIQQSGAALRYFISNPNVSQVDWLVQKNIFEKVEQQVGGVLISFGGLWERNLAINEIRLVPKEKGVEYSLYSKNQDKPYSHGFGDEGALIKTNWMNLELKFLRFHPKAIVKWDMKKNDHPTSQTTQAIKVIHQNTESWLPLNDYLKIFTDKNIYLLSFMNKRVVLPFSLNLKKFEKINYQGTMRAMAYSSEVIVDDLVQTHQISMNEPLKVDRYLFYQASFEESPQGGATASILSVNYDPGRILKYLGSIIMCLGIVMLFYFKRKRR